MESKDSSWKDPVIEYYKRRVDRGAIRDNLQLTVTERFEKAMALQRFAEEMRRARREARCNEAKESQPPMNTD